MHKLLIVDDDEAMRRMLKSRLAANYEVIETGDAGQVVELTLAHKPLAILMDLMMPEFSGFELCRGLRDLSYTSRIPIFIVSGESEGRCKEHCQRLGAADYFQKPVDFNRLQGRLMDVIQKEQPERRSSARVQMKVGIRLRGIDMQGHRFDEMTATENVSIDGFLCPSQISLIQNTIVEVFVVSSEGKVAYAGRARVARRADPDTPWQKYGFQFQSKTSHWVLQHL